MGREGTATFRTEPNNTICDAEKVNTELGSHRRGEGVGAAGKKWRPPRLPLAPLGKSLSHTASQGTERRGALGAGNVWSKFSPLLAVRPWPARVPL